MNAKELRTKDIAALEKRVQQLRRSEDSGVDELFQGVVERGMPLMRG